MNKLCFTPIFFLLIFFTLQTDAQQTQTVRGQVIEELTRNPVFAANVFIKISEGNILGISTDENGNFKIENVPVGRRIIECSAIGYESYVTASVEINSAKEMVLSIELREAVYQQNEVVIKAHSKAKPVNDNSLVSTRSFSMEETDRYAGSYSDVGRMAMSFAGVRMSQDNNSDIIIRGNSPVGLLFRMDGFDIPNPNHFARKASTGGGISLMSTAMLSGSDFSTGAFAAEYGDALSGVFDFHLRKGNNEKREYTFKAGIIGLDLAAEGPFSMKKKSASYLVNYRYSALALLDKLGFHVSSSNETNTFQDLSFHISVPSVKQNYFSIFGVGGLSSSITFAVKDTSQWKEYADSLTGPFVTNTGILGITHTTILDERSYVKTGLCISAQEIYWDDILESKKRILDTINIEYYFNSRIQAMMLHSYKFSSELSMKSGIYANQINYNEIKKEKYFPADSMHDITNGNGGTQLFQAFSGIQYRPNAFFTYNIGVHALYLLLNNTYSVEPRAAVSYMINEHHTVSFAYGLHGQILPLGSYFTQTDHGNGIFTFPNLNLEMTKAHHLVLGYDLLFAEDYHVKLETYYQFLFNVPVATASPYTYWLLNERNSYAQDSMVSRGTGLNYGVDLTFEKFYDRHWFFLVAASIYRSQYVPYNGETYPTRYDSRYSSSSMLLKEFVFKRSNSLELGTRILFSGGLRYSPVDLTASELAGKEIRDQLHPYSLQAPAYFRMDLRIAYHKNRKNYSYILSLDIQNLTNRSNVLLEVYNDADHTISYRYQAGLLPVLNYTVDF